MPLTIYGASDDLIEIEGDFSEEFNFYPNEDRQYVLGFSDGTLLRVEYDVDGLWRLHLVHKGDAEFSKIEGSVEDDTNDKVTLNGLRIAWVVLGSQFATHKGGK